MNGRDPREDILRADQDQVRFLRFSLFCGNSTPPGSSDWFDSDQTAEIIAAFARCARKRSLGTAGAPLNSPQTTCNELGSNLNIHIQQSTRIRVPIVTNFF